MIKDIRESSTVEIMPSKRDKQTIVVDIVDTIENDQIEQPTSTIFSLLENEKTSTIQPDIDRIAFTLNRRSQQKPILIEVAKTDAIKQVSHLSDNDLQSVEVNLNKENFPERERSSGVENFELEQENKIKEEDN